MASREKRGQDDTRRDAPLEWAKTREMNGIEALMWRAESDPRSCATMITLVTHGDTCCIAVNLDRAAITEPELFGQCLEDGFAEVLALHEGAEPPLRRR